MKKLNNYLDMIGLGWIFKLSVLVSIALLITGFLLPPMAVIDGTVLIAVAEIMIFVLIPTFFAFASDNHVKIKGDLDDKSIEVSSEPKNKQ